MNGDAVTEPALTGLPMCLPESNQARAEARCFFSRLGVPEGPGLERLADRVLARCQGLRGVAPASVAAWLLAAWVGGALGAEVEQRLGVSAAQAAVLLAEAGQHWPDHLLADGPLPDGLAAALRSALPQPVPRPLPLAMPAQPLAPPAFGVPRLVAWGLGVEQRS